MNSRVVVESAWVTLAPDISWVGASVVPERCCSGGVGDGGVLKLGAGWFGFQNIFWGVRGSGF